MPRRSATPSPTIRVASPACDDRSLDALSHHLTDDGRVEIYGNVTQSVGEKFVAMIDERSVPRPEPDGSPDRRSASQIRADALEVLLDQAAAGASMDTIGAPRTQTLLTIPRPRRQPRIPALDRTDHPSHRETVVLRRNPDRDHHRRRNRAPADGPRTTTISPHTCARRSSSATRTASNAVPPPSHTQVHHIEHWTDNGETELDNGCLLCQRCHTQVHHNGWDIMIGFDRHPWLIPPADIDPQRRPLPAYNRRTMRLDDAA